MVTVIWKCGPLIFFPCKLECSLLLCFQILSFASIGATCFTGSFMTGSLLDNAIFPVVNITLNDHWSCCFMLYSVRLNGSNWGLTLTNIINLLG